MSLAIPQAQARVPAPAPSFDLGASDSAQISARTIIGYGGSGLGKSTNARFFAQWMYEHTGKPVRLIAFEDSSKTIFEPVIDLKIVEAVFLSKAEQPLYMLRRFAKGDWPIFGPDGRVTKWEPLRANTISAYIIEGLTSASESLLEEARDEHRFLREQASDSFELGTEKFCTSSQTAFGFTQQEMLRAVKGFGMLPVNRVLWTAHECVGADEDTKDPIRGPGLVGKAATDKVRKYCGVLLHFDLDRPKVGLPKIRVYFKQHPDAKFNNINYPAKVTIPVEMVPLLDQAFPNGYFEPGTSYGTGLDKFLALTDSLVSQFTNADLSQWKARIDEQHFKEMGK